MAWVVLAILFCIAVEPAPSAQADGDPAKGGAFARPIPTAAELEAYQLAMSRPSSSSPAIGELYVDSSGNTNEVLLLADGANPALKAMLPTLNDAPMWNSSAEDALVRGVRAADMRVLSAFGNPIDARYMIEQARLEAAIRDRLDVDDPLETLHRYVVLRYASVASAGSALGRLQSRLGSAMALMNLAMEFSWAPNDPYFAIKPAATNAALYQWGLHAMKFPAAWDTARGHGYVAVVDGGIAIDSTPATTDDIFPNVDLRENLRLQFYTRTAYGTGTSSYHGSHVSGIIAAAANNGQGVAGGCSQCSLVMTELSLSAASIASAITSSVQVGAQVVNMSWGNGATGATAVPPCPAIGHAYQVVCTALTLATNRDVVLVGAAGNYMQTTPQFPAREPNVLSVAGAELITPGNPTSWRRWYFGPASSSPNGEGSGVTIGSNNAGIAGVVAPARGIVSTFPAAGLTHSYSDYYCSDSATQHGVYHLPLDESGIPNDTYASCSGTSMAAPHVSALAGLLRSINPRLSAEQIKRHIRDSGDYASLPNSIVGAGMPNANSATASVVAATPNRLTPLFALYGIGRQDYFYTSVPQMGAAAACGSLRPRAGGTTTQNQYHAIGAAISGYLNFPDAASATCSGARPSAQAWVFTTPKNPKSSTDSLVPLYRLSWKCGDPSSSAPTSICANNPQHVDTTYTTDAAGIAAFKTIGYKLDGIEGYIYPKTSPQPTGATKLMRKYNPTRDDHAIFPETVHSAMIAEGYTQASGSDWLGYVYVNTGSVPAIP